jgi:hypothetical protein
MAPDGCGVVSDSLAIMAKKVVEVRVCDRCGKQPAHTWTIIGPEGAACEIELCEQHGAAVANAYALGRAVPRRTTRPRPVGRRPKTVAHPPPPPTPVPPEPRWR